MTTARGGTSPRSSTGSSPRTSMIGVDAVSTTLAPSTASPDPHALDDDAARADEGAVLDDHRAGLQRLEHAADPDAAREVDVGADLRARADGRPGVDHRPRADPRADVDVAGHQHGARRDVGAVADGAGGTTRTPRSAQPLFSGILSWYSNGPDLDRLHAARAELEQDRLLGPLVDAPAGVGRRRDAHAAVVEQRDRLLDGRGGLLAEVARRALVELLDLGGRALRSVQRSCARC